MKISLEWLKEYLPGETNAVAAGEALTHGGLPVEVFEKFGDDDVIDVEVTSNRGDCLSHVGVARELSALMGRDFNDVKPIATEVATPAEDVTDVQIEATNLCPHYIARVIRNVKIGPSPAWMQRRLEAIGLRPINNVVDVTNYVMFEMGQPLHAFDFDKLADNRIVVRTARQGETLVSIDGHERKLSADMLVIADANKPVALAGVMGGRDSEVSNQTTNILLEAARFDPLSVRKTARALAMKSDSSYRFERGIDPTLPDRASLRAAQLILQIAGGELLKGSVEDGDATYHPKTLWLRTSRLKQLLGVEFPEQVVVNALAKLGLRPVVHGERIDVTVPSHRLDLNIEVDLIEEVARVVGYDKIPVRDEIAIRLSPPSPDEKTIHKLREAMVASGYFESITFSFVSDALAEDFQPAGAKSLARADHSVRKADGQLRPSLLPGLLESVRRNESVGTMGAKLFEIGSTFWIDSAGKIDERRQLGLVGSKDLHEVRGTIESLLARLNADRAMKIVPDNRKGFAAGAVGRIEWGGETIGWLGQIDKKVAEKLSLREFPFAAEIELSPLLKNAQHVPQLKPLPRFPAVRRDISLLVTDAIRYEQLDDIIRKTRSENLEDWEYVTTYRGKPLEKGSKSVTITLIFRSPDTTLTSEQVEGGVQKIVTAAKDELNATLRV